MFATYKSGCIKCAVLLVSLQVHATYFEDVTAVSGLADETSYTLHVGDFNNDNYPDVLASGKLYQNISTYQGALKLIDVTANMGIKTKIEGSPLFIDINNDGALDIISNKGQVWIQKNNKYSEAQDLFQPSFPNNVHTISFADINQDGYVDLFLGPNEIHQNNNFTFSPNKVYLNQGGQKFIDISDMIGISQYSFYTRGIAWADFNNDKKLDSYYSNYRLRPNLLLNWSTNSVKDLAPAFNVQGVYDTKKYFDPYYKTQYGPQYGHTIGSTWADFNNDGFLDLWVANLVHKFVGMSQGAYDIRGYVCDDSKIYKNMGAPQYQLVDVRHLSRIPLKPMGPSGVYVGDELWAHTTAADFDNDSLTDMYVSQVYNLNYAHSLLYKNLGNFQFQDVGAGEPIRVLDSYAAAWADFNNDGKVDLIVSGRGGVDVPSKLRLLKNVTTNNYNYIKIKLIGRQSGRNPVGTQVKLFHKNGILLKQYEGVTGTIHQQNEATLHFGLKEVVDIQKMEIRWSSGKVQIFTNLKANNRYTIDEQL